MAYGVLCVLPGALWVHGGAEHGGTCGGEKERDADDFRTECLQTSGRAPAALCAPAGCFGCIRIGRCMPDTHLGKASGAGVFLAGDQQGVSERNRRDSGCIAACWSIGVVRTKGAACKDLREKKGEAGFPGMAVLGALVGGFCVYTMIYCHQIMRFDRKMKRRTDR